MGFPKIHQKSNKLKGYKYEIYPIECLDGVCDFTIRIVNLCWYEPITSKRIIWDVFWLPILR